MENIHSIHVLHVDDEQSCIDSMRSIIACFPELDYHEGFTDPVSCLEYIDENPGEYLIFSDMEMEPYNGLWLAEQLKDTSHGIVFVTNHSNYALSAFDACALDFIIKPVTAGKLLNTLELIKERKMKLDTLFVDRVKSFYSFMEQKEPPKRVFVPMTGQIQVVMLEQAIYLTSKESYTEFVLKDNVKVLSSQRIKTYEEVLINHPDFIRIHKSHIINKQYLRSISKAPRNYKAVMSNNDALEISYERKEEILEKLMV